jgi:hypothetical protein
MTAVYRGHDRQVTRYSPAGGGGLGKSSLAVGTASIALGCCGEAAFLLVPIGFNRRSRGLVH